MEDSTGDRRHSENESWEKYLKCIFFVECKYKHETSLGDVTNKEAMKNTE